MWARPCPCTRNTSLQFVCQPVVIPKYLFPMITINKKIGAVLVQGGGIAGVPSVAELRGRTDLMMHLDYTNS